ncbi:hypothetical protein WA026_011365 [Henosepilachna vigintioctopunctata]|uniref:Ig-like domain-containing protein n=1 Tax=Henosepilachna vigintioctopunctata TaxID=420089 RepID=A0AAW1TRL0_9CUCU
MGENMLSFKRITNTYGCQATTSMKLYMKKKQQLCHKEKNFFRRRQHWFVETLKTIISQSLKDVVLRIEPRVVQLRATSTLSCEYDLEDAPLYTVKWYRGHHEFYRYTPKEFPSTKIFPFTGVHVDVSRDLYGFTKLEENTRVNITRKRTLVFSSLY